MKMRSMLLSGTALLAAMLLSQPAKAPPPPMFPQACAPSFCVEVIPTYPNAPGRFTVDAKVSGGDEKLTMAMGNGTSISFRSKIVDRRSYRQNSEARWNRNGSNANAWACLRCGAGRGNDTVLDIVLTGITPYYDADLYGFEACFWTLDMSAAGYGDGKTMRLGKKVCIKGKNWHKRGS